VKVARRVLRGVGRSNAPDLPDHQATAQHAVARRHYSSARPKGTRQRSRSVQEKTILTVAELRELPPGRAICFASGTPAVLIEPQPWFLGKDAAVIEASRKAHSPARAEPEPLAASPWTVKAIDE